MMHALMRLLFCLTMVAFLSSGSHRLWGQSFTRITAGTVVLDGGRSTGSNWIDYDGDGDLDLFVANGNLNNQSDFLYRNEGDGTFTRLTEGELVTESTASIGGTWGDYDNDGDLDAYISTRQGQLNALYRNDGEGVFVRNTEGAFATDQANSNGASWVDIDNDGDLDLFVINFNEAHFLYLNEGGGTFSKDTEGLLVTDVSFSINGIWGDYDGDKDQDLFIVNGGSQHNALYRNEGGGQFTRILEGPLVNDGMSAIGGSWGDYNNDGFLDLFVATFLNQNNALYTNNGDGTFTQVTEGDLVNDPGNSVGSAWGDVDNDGDLDLFVGNDGQANFLYLNENDGTFTKVTRGEVVQDVANTFGVSMGDYDQDGDLDLYAANRENQNNVLYANDGTTNNWVSLRLEGTISNASAIGAVVRVRALVNGVDSWQMREIASQSGYNSQNLDAWFGLAEATRVEELRVEWPSGQVLTLADIPANQRITITETETPVGIEPQEAVWPTPSYRVDPTYPNPFTHTTTIPFTLSAAGYVTLKIYDAVGHEVEVLLADHLPAGHYRATWRAYRFASGSYLYRFQAGTSTTSGRLILVK